MKSNWIICVSFILIFTSLSTSGLIGESQNFSEFDVVYTLKGHNRIVGALAWSPDGNLLASSSGDDVFIWNLTNGKVFKRIQSFSSNSALAWDPNGKRLAYNTGHIFEIFNIKSGVVEKIFDPSYYVTSLTWSPNKDVIVVTSGDMSLISIWNISSETSIYKSNPHKYFIRDISFNPNGSYLATCATNGTIKIWNTDSWEVFQTFLGEAQPIGDVFSISWHPNGSYLASCYRSGNISIWDITSGEIVWNKQVYNIPLSGHLAWSPDGKYLASTGNLKLNIWNITTKESIIELESYHAYPIAWSPNGMMIATPGKIIYGDPSGDIFSILVYGEHIENKKLNTFRLDDIYPFMIMIIFIAIIATLIILIKIKFGGEKSKKE